MKKEKKKRDPKKIRRFWFDVLAVLVGGFLWAVGLNMFIVPNDIAPNGITGIATIIHHFTSFPIGIMTILLNIPLFFISWKQVSLRFAVSSAIVMSVTSVIIDMTALFLPAFDDTSDPFLAALYGGVLSGVGLGLIYARGLATGGVDIIARILEKPFPFISYGNMIILLDVIVIASAAIAYGDYRVALYSLVVTYLSGFINDKILMGLDRGKLVHVISETRYREIEQAILVRINRGVTEMRVKGAYTDHEKGMLMVVCRPYELFRIKTLIREIDPEAFVIVSDATEIVGNGFRTEEGKNGGS